MSMRRHGQAGAVDHAADRTVERDVIEIVFRRLDFLLVFFGEIAQRNDVGMAVERVAIEADLGVETDDLVVLGHDQRIDLEQAHVLGRERGIELGQDLFDLLGEIARELERLRHAAAMMRHDAGGRIDREGEDFLRRLVRNFLDIHAAFGGDDESDARRLAIDQRRQIELSIDGRAFFDIEAVDLLAVRACLMRDQSRTENARRLPSSRRRWISPP